VARRFFVARDIRTVTDPGENYDPEFDLLLRGQVVPEVIENYSDKFLARVIKGVVVRPSTVALRSPARRSVGLGSVRHGRAAGVSVPHPSRRPADVGGVIDHIL